MTETIGKEIRSFVVSNFLFGQADAALGDEQSFLGTGIVDSTGVLELVAFLEQRFAISVDDRDLVPENLDSIGNAARFVARKLESRKVSIAG